MPCCLRIRTKHIGEIGDKNFTVASNHVSNAPAHPPINQVRYDDTNLLMHEVGEHGPRSARGKVWATMIHLLTSSVSFVILVVMAP